MQDTILRNKGYYLVQLHLHEVFFLQVLRSLPLLKIIKDKSVLLLVGHFI